MNERPSKWVVKVTFLDGETRYYCGSDDGRVWMKTRGNALRYDTEFEAITRGYQLKGGYKRIVEVEAEEIMNPRARY